MSGVVRPAASGDMDAIASILNESIVNTHANFSVKPTSAGEQRRAWLADCAMYPWLVAEEGGSVVGFARACRWKGRCAYDWSAEVAVYVDKAARGTGVGFALYEQLFDLLRRQGYRSLLAGIALPDKPSVRLHEKVGMHCVGTLTRMGYKLGQWWDVGYWQIVFGEGPPGEILPVPAGQDNPVD